MRLGIDGRVDTRRIFGIRLLGIRIRIRRGSKVITFFFFLDAEVIIHFGFSKFLIDYLICVLRLFVCDCWRGRMDWAVYLGKDPLAVYVANDVNGGGDFVTLKFSTVC